VTYTEDINDNDEFFGKIRADLAAGNDLKRDLITLTDWMCARLIRLNWVQELDHGNIPNLENLQPALRNVSWDAGRRHSVPWQSGVTGIAYNEKLTRPVRTVDELLTRPDLRGRVTVLKEMRDTIGLLLAQRGKSPASFTDADFDTALETLDDAVRNRQIRRFTGNDYTQDLAAGNVAACLAWSGDVVQLQADNPSVKFLVPEAGGLLFSDNLMVPNKAAHKKNAELLIDHYYDPKVAAQLAASVNYICPVVGAQEEMRALDPELANNPLIFPDAATLARLTVFRGLDEKTERRYNDAFQKVSGA
ncbi:MAG TPA: spermidine/putrescine ABC transporter substrate-binding protein, partial [Cryptosporangiaceae bacterium]|nr:spermidine/putrescine ABC transporter substrate-binding protein [Cryptosporangiaceae bacterium]